jgi:hypothetical protein
MKMKTETRKYCYDCLSGEVATTKKTHAKDPLKAHEKRHTKTHNFHGRRIAKTPKKKKKKI